MAISVSNANVPALDNPNVVGASVPGPITTLTDGATITVDCNRGSNFQVTLGGNRTIQFINPQPGQTVELIVTQDGTGSRLVTWTDVIWPSATAPTLTATASRSDIITLMFNASVAKMLGRTYGLNYIVA